MNRRYLYLLLFVISGLIACQNPPLQEDQAVVEYDVWEKAWLSEYKRTKRIIKTPEKPFSFYDLIDKHNMEQVQQKDFDTLTVRKQLSMYNQPYELQVRKFCLNDSSVYKKQMDCTITIYHSHDYATQLLLHQDTTLILDTSLTKHTFKDSLLAHLDEKNFKAMTLRNVEYDFVRTNRLYFNAYFYNVMARTEKEEALVKIQFSIFYQTPKKGKLDYWGTETILSKSE